MAHFPPDLCRCCEERQTRPIDIFNGNYGLNRGLAAASFALACVAALHAQWLIAFGLVLLSVIYAYRAYRFGVYYARELYVQFLVLSEANGENA